MLKKGSQGAQTMTARRKAVEVYQKILTSSLTAFEGKDRNEVRRRTPNVHITVNFQFLVDNNILPSPSKLEK
jgi:hypothetical protein